MNDQQLISHIEELGLSNKEARVYVACLVVGPSPVQRIADQAGIKRVTAYVILESLVGLGLVSQSIKGKKTFFIAEDPSNLEHLLEKRESELKEQRTNFEHILPQLKGLKSLPKDSPSVKFYDSPDGIKTAIKAFLDKSNQSDNAKMVYGISNLDQLYVFFPEFRQAAGNPERARAGLPSHYLYTSAEGAILQGTDTRLNRTSRYMPIEEFPFTGDITIIGDNIMLLSLSGQRPIGITIESAELAKSMRALFQIAWTVAEQYN